MPSTTQEHKFLKWLRGGSAKRAFSRSLKTPPLARSSFRSTGCHGFNSKTPIPRTTRAKLSNGSSRCFRGGLSLAHVSTFREICHEQSTAGVENQRFWIRRQKPPMARGCSRRHSWSCCRRLRSAAKDIRIQELIAELALRVVLPAQCNKLRQLFITGL